MRVGVGLDGGVEGGEFLCEGQGAIGKHLGQGLHAETQHGRDDSVAFAQGFPVWRDGDPVQRVFVGGVFGGDVHIVLNGA